MADVVMPRLSDSMEEGTILRWLKAPGDSVRRGEELVEIETDKATMTYEADSDGVLEIVAGEGATLPIGEVIARLGAGEGTSTPAADQTPVAGEGAEGTVGGQPAAPPAIADLHVADAAPPTGGAVAAGDVVAREALAPSGPAPDAPTRADGARIKASPVARRMARDRGIDLGAVTGSGPGARIVRADVEAAATGGPGQATVPAAPATSTAAAAGTPASTVPAAAPAASGAETNRGEVTTVQTTRTQQVIARRMAESRATIPSFEVSTEVAMDACVALRAQLKALPGGQAPSYNDLVVKACALALREHPRVNGAYKDGAFELYERVNVGIAVAADDALVVPVISRADEKSLTQIAQESRALAGRVRDGAITPPEVSGGTFTVSNLGMFGVSHFTAVINPGQAAILAVGALIERPVIRDGAVVAGHTMTLTLASDHRILYGADSARFLARVRELLEHPLSMVV